MFVMLEMYKIRAKISIVAKNLGPFRFFCSPVSQPAEYRKQVNFVYCL